MAINNNIFRANNNIIKIGILINFNIISYNCLIDN